MRIRKASIVPLLLLATLGHAYGLARQERPTDAALPRQAVWKFTEAGKAADDSRAPGVNLLEYSDDGKRLAVRTRENLVLIFDTVTHEKLLSIRGHDNNWIVSVDFSPDGNWIITAAGSGESVKIWSSQTGELKAEIETDAEAAYFSDEGKQIFVLGRTHVEHYAWPVCELIEQYAWQANREQRLAMSRDGRLVVKVRHLNRDLNQTEILDLHTNSTTALPGMQSVPGVLAISHDNNWVAAVGYRENKIHLWDLRVVTNGSQLLAEHREPVQSIAFSPDSRWLVSGGSDNRVIAWDLLTNQPLESYAGHSEQVKAVAISPRDFGFASGANGPSDYSVIIWDLKSAIFPTPEIQSSERPVFDQVWNSLGASSAETSLHATHDLISNATEYLPELRRRVIAGTDSATDESLDDLIDRLNDASFQNRETATLRLIDLRNIAEPKLQQVLNQHLSQNSSQMLPVEARYRIQRVLGDLPVRPQNNIVEFRRWQRIVFALELIQNPLAELILRRIADGHSNIDLAAAARASLDRRHSIETK